MMLAKPASSPYLRLARAPQGPTLSFKIHEYALASDIARSQARPRCPPDLFKNSPLVTICAYKFPKLLDVIYRSSISLLQNFMFLSCTSINFMKVKQKFSYFHIFMERFGIKANVWSFYLQIVLSGFGSGEQHLKLTTIMFQNIFPAIDINTVSSLRIFCINNISGAVFLPVSFLHTLIHIVFFPSVLNLRSISPCASG